MTGSPAGDSDPDLDPADRLGSRDGGSPTEPDSGPFLEGFPPPAARPDDLDSLPELPGLEWAHFLGKGGAGAVFAARERATDRLVAVKLLHPDLDRSMIARRFEDEIETLGRLRHRNIAGVISGGLLPDGRLYSVMELVPGVPITEAARSRGLSLRRRIELLIGVADGLAHAHREKILHRDLKPSNVLLGEDGVPRIVDFGTALSLHPEASRQTQPGRRIGTEVFMSPEQRRGERALDERSDVYSLALLGFELLADLRITAAGGEQEGFIPRYREQALGKLPRSLADLLGRASESDRSLRLSDAASLADDLRRVLADLPIVNRAVSRRERAVLFIRRHSVEASVIAASLGVFLFTTILAFAALLEARERERLADELRRETTAVLDLISQEIAGGGAALPPESAPGRPEATLEKVDEGVVAESGEPEPEAARLERPETGRVGDF